MLLSLIFDVLHNLIFAELTVDEDKIEDNDDEEEENEIEDEDGEEELDIDYTNIVSTW